MCVPWALQMRILGTVYASELSIVFTLVHLSDSPQTAISLANLDEGGWSVSQGAGISRSLLSP